ncbi:TonB-dependent receptor [Sphingomonas sp. PB4P5]|uniref:TonB-dependent receptor n=1 Tax=Parasphingomonas puruogangriensis TaxID=3096155 RepID=UPI002FC8C1EF
MTAFRRALGVSSAIAAVLLSSAATAQATQSESDDAATEAGEPRDIIVTAQKREQLLIDVPQSVSVVSGDTLERQQATSFKDYLKLIPGLQLNQSTPGFGRLVLRGVNTGGVASTVAVYQDETIFGSSTGLVNGGILAGDFDTFDVARIEVLRGPQGTFYGANALGGILKFVTNKPDTSRIEARGRATVETTKGGDESYLASAVVNVPLSDTLAVRASGFYRNLGGFIDSVGTDGADVERNINSSKSYGGRGSLLFQPTTDFSIQLSAYIQNLDVDAPDTVDADPLTGRTLYGRPTQSQFVPNESKVRYRVYSGVINYDFGFASLVSATSYSTLKQDFRSDLTYFFSPQLVDVIGPNEFYQGQTTEVKRFTQEVRLQSPSNDRFEWVVGGFYTRERGLIDQVFTAVTPGTVTPIAGLPVLGIAQVPSRYREIAGFANATVHFGPRFDLDFGGRYSHNKQRASQSGDGLLAGGPLVLPEARSSEGVFTYSVAPKVKFGDDASLYARVAKGFRPGGPNVQAPGAPAEFRSFRSDTVLSYEIGVKGQTSDGSFSIDVAAFHVDWKDIQVFGQTLANGVPYGGNFNGGKAKSEGFEFTARLRPTPGFTTSINGAYTNARLQDDTPANAGGRDGDQLPYVPKYSISADTQYEWALTPGTRAYVGGSLRALSRQAAAFDAGLVATTGRQPAIASYQVADARAGLLFGKFSLEIYAKNLGNSEGKTSLDLPPVPTIPFGASAAGIIRPRTFGVTLGAGF